MDTVRALVHNKRSRLDAPTRPTRVDPETKPSRAEDVLVRYRFRTLEQEEKKIDAKNRTVEMSNLALQNGVISTFSRSTNGTQSANGHSAVSILTADGKLFPAAQVD